eukprot:4837223-Prymnesium_polylepis.2
MGARAGAGRVGAGPGKVLSKLATRRRRKACRDQGIAYRGRDGSVAFAPEPRSPFLSSVRATPRPMMGHMPPLRFTPDKGYGFTCTPLSP